MQPVIKLLWSSVSVVFSVQDADDLTSQTVIENLAAVIDISTVTRINVSRLNVWEAARRAIKKKTFNPQSTVMVKFTDDIGMPEGAIDHGGPCREFFQLVMECMRSNCALFCGPSNSRQINYISSGTYWRSQLHYMDAHTSTPLMLTVCHSVEGVFLVLNVWQCLRCSVTFIQNNNLFCIYFNCHDFLSGKCMFRPTCLKISKL